MRIHLQNLPGTMGQPLTQAEWDAAAARAELPAGAHRVSLGETMKDFARAAPEIEMLVTATSITKTLFPAELPRLKLLFCTSAGLDSVPFDALPPGIAVLNNRGVHGPKAGEYGIMALLMLANHIPLAATNQRAERWHRHHSTIMPGRRVTIVGVGGLGGAVAEHAARFGMRVTGVRARALPHKACERVVPTAELDSVLPETEFLVLACPLTEQTRNLLDRRRIGLLPKDAGVINIGRGGLVEQDALCDALDAGALSGAVLDVFVPEPVPPGHRLWTTRNLIMTPHVSSDDRHAYNARSLDTFIRNLRAYERGEELPNLFDRGRGY